MRLRTLFPLFLMFLTGPAVAGELRVYPPEVTVSGPNRLQQLLVIEEENGRVVADHTAAAKFATSDDKVAKADAAGLVTATGDGEATVSAAAGGRTATAKVKVSGMGGPGGWTFRNHVVPTLTRAGCNSGACHGALAGKGGMKLSLRGYDPESDFFVLTRQALARRVELSNPTDSLMLKKPTRALPHGGGTRFADESEHYALLLDWIKAGAPGPKDADPQLDRIEVFPTAALLKPRTLFA
jgi:hypothetical protein